MRRGYALDCSGRKTGSVRSNEGLVSRGCAESAGSRSHAAYGGARGRVGLVDMEFDAALGVIQRADDETDGRWRKSIAGMSRDDRRYRTIARLIVQA